MAPTRRALKRAHSIKVSEMRSSKFSTVVRKQKGLCWYCNEPMGVDCTKEHLLAQKLGGTDTYPRGNLKAAHGECNSAAGHLPVQVKKLLREICKTEGKREMLFVARQFRRAEARMGFAKIKGRYP